MKLGLAPLLSIMMLVIAAPLLAASAGCKPATTHLADEKPPCDLGTLAELEAEYTAEAVSTCKGKTRATCPEMPAIEAKYSEKRERWIRCH